MPSSFKPHNTLTEQVAAHLEQLIASGALKSGQRIYENTMAKELGVSHGSVREALLQLEKRHLIKNVPRKGAFVTELDAHFVRSLYEVMVLYLSYTGVRLLRQWQPEDMERLESLYERMRAHHLKGELMDFLEVGIEYTQASLAYAGNYFVTTAIQDLWPSAKRCAFVALRQGNRILEDNLQHMRDSLDAIQARDEERLKTILSDYAMQQCEQVLACLPAEKTAS
jgi:DNA-binding GntR family transcriptional regulator